MKVWIGRQDEWNEGQKPEGGLFREDYDVVLMPRVDGGFNYWKDVQGMKEGIPPEMRDGLITWDEQKGRKIL